MPKRTIDRSSNALGITLMGPLPTPKIISLDRALNREIYSETHEMVLRLKYMKRVILKLNELVNVNEISKSPAGALAGSRNET